MSWLNKSGLVFILCGLFTQTVLAKNNHENIKPNILLLLADNWAYPHASIYGDPVVQTPTFDQLAREGAKFTNAFCLVPSCAPARAVLLTGQPIHRLDAGASNWGYLAAKYPV